MAHNYDVMNDLMSGGVHRVWKEQFVAALGPAPGIRALDVAGGTGDIAFRIIEALKLRYPAPAFSAPASVGGAPAAAGGNGVRASSVTVCDINASMLGVGRERAQARGYRIVNTTPDFVPAPLPAASTATSSSSAAASPSSAGSSDAISLRFVLGDAERLPFADRSFDAYTIAFGLRNVTHTEQALREAYRVLDRGARFMCLEFSRVPNPVLSQLYDAYSFAVIPRLGEWVAQDRASYQYLVESIRKFPPQQVRARCSARLCSAPTDVPSIVFLCSNHGWMSCFASIGAVCDDAPRRLPARHIRQLFGRSGVRALGLQTLSAARLRLELERLTAPTFPGQLHIQRLY